MPYTYKLNVFFLNQTDDVVLFFDSFHSPYRDGQIPPRWGGGNSPPGCGPLSYSHSDHASSASSLLPPQLKIGHKKGTPSRIM